MSQYDKVQEALDILGLPTHITLKDITQRYRYLASKNHPDKGGETEKMAKINEAYKVLKGYIEEYRFSFSEEEISKQFPNQAHSRKFRF